MDDDFSECLFVRLYRDTLNAWRSTPSRKQSMDRVKYSLCVLSLCLVESIFAI